MIDFLASFFPPREIMPVFLILVATSAGVFLMLDAFGGDVIERKAWRWGDAPRRPRAPANIFSVEGVAVFLVIIAGAGVLGAFR